MPTHPVESWVALYERELLRHLRRMRPHDAEDLLQQVWLKAWERPPPDPDGNVRAWLYRVATNAALDRIARDRTRQRVLAGAGGRLVADTAAGPDAWLAGLDEGGRRRVRTELARLPRKQREAVWLRWVEGADYDEIAERTDSTPAGARANVYQGLKRLRSELADLWRREGGQ